MKLLKLSIEDIANNGLCKKIGLEANKESPGEPDWLNDICLLFALQPSDGALF